MQLKTALACHQTFAQAWHPACNCVALQRVRLSSPNSLTRSHMPAVLNAENSRLQPLARGFRATAHIRLTTTNHDHVHRLRGMTRTGRGSKIQLLVLRFLTRAQHTAVAVSQAKHLRRRPPSWFLNDVCGTMTHCATLVSVERVAKSLLLQVSDITDVSQYWMKGNWDIGLTIQGWKFNFCIIALASSRARNGVTAEMQTEQTQASPQPRSSQAS